MRKIIRWTCIEGILAILVMFFLPFPAQAEGYDVALFRSLSSLFVLLCALLAWLNRSASLKNDSENWPDTSQRLAVTLILMATSLIVGLCLAAVLLSRAGHWFGWVYAAFYACWPLVIWVILANLQWLLWIIYRHRQEMLQTIFWKQPIVSQTLVLLAAGLCVLFHWLILIFNLPLLDMIPGWFWKFISKPFTVRAWLFAAISGWVLLTAWLILTGRLRSKWTLLALMGLGYALQFSFGYIEGQGIESLRLKYALTAHKSYAEHAADQPDLWEALTNYESHYSRDIYLGTKPPGVLLIYALAQKASVSIFNPQNYNERFIALTTLIAWVFPLLAMGVLWPLTRIKQELDPADDDLLPALLFMVCPNVILIPLFLDQALYPLLFISCLLLWWHTLKYKSMAGACLTGLLIYLSLYFTFSMLPIIPLALAWLGIEVWREAGWRAPRRWLGVVAALSLGLLGGYILLRWGLNYDLLLRYTHAMEHHRAIKTFQIGLPFILQATWVNTIDIAAWSGFPLCVLFILSAFQSGIRIFKRHADQLDGLLLAFSATYLALNLFGQTRGEVGRIWLFMVPVFVLGAVRQLRHLVVNKQKWSLIFILVQLITIFLTYQFQDFFA